MTYTRSRRQTPRVEAGRLPFGGCLLGGRRKGGEIQKSLTLTAPALTLVTVEPKSIGADRIAANPPSLR